MKLNNKGFAISSVMYSLLILAVSLMFGILAILVSRKMTLDKVKDNVRKTVNGDIIIVPEEYKGINPKVYAVGEHVSYANLDWIVVKDNGNNVTVVLNDKIAASNNDYANYKTDLTDFIDGNPVLSIAKKNNYILNMSFTGGPDYVRTLTLNDIYGSSAIPTTLSKTTSILPTCNYCASNYDYYLLDNNGTSTYIVRYDATDKVNYLDAATGASNVRPVITIKEKN